MKKKKVLKVVLLVVLALCIIIATGFGIYVSDYYHASDVTYASDNGISKKEYKGCVAYGDINSDKGMIFYPGGKVEASAYEPLLCEISKKGYLCILVDMPFNLAVFDINAADDVKKQFNGISEWYIGGHSLGGAMAASYVSKHQNEYKGLILMAAYPTKKLESTIKVLSLYGSEDKVLNMQKYEKSIGLADNLTEVIINGGNHGHFGNYGEQKGDGQADISAKSQWEQTAEAVKNFID